MIDKERKALKQPPENGVALLTVLLLVAVMAVIAATAVTDPCT